MTLTPVYIIQKYKNIIIGDLLTYLNIYMSFEQYGLNDKDWCYRHFINRSALLRAREIRMQLVKYMKKFSLPLISCREAPVYKGIYIYVYV